MFGRTCKSTETFTTKADKKKWLQIRSLREGIFAQRTAEKNPNKVLYGHDSQKSLSSKMVDVVTSEQKHRNNGSIYRMFLGMKALGTIAGGVRTTDISGSPANERKNTL